MAIKKTTRLVFDGGWHVSVRFGPWAGGTRWPSVRHEWSLEDVVASIAGVEISISAQLPRNLSADGDFLTPSILALFTAPANDSARGHETDQRENQNP